MLHFLFDKPLCFEYNKVTLLFFLGMVILCIFVDIWKSKVKLRFRKNYPVVMVCGQRQVGKSTMLNHIKETGRKYVTLDDMNARRLAETDPALFFETYGTPLLIDEFQRVPSILLEMKRIVDQKALDGEDNNGMFWLTGSQKFRMMQNVSESLAGRVAVFDLAGLSQAELDGREVGLFCPEINALKERATIMKHKNIHEIFRFDFPWRYAEIARIRHRT